MSAHAATGTSLAAASPAAGAGARNPWSHRKPLASRTNALDSLHEWLASTGVGADVQPEQRASLLLAEDASRSIELVADLNKARLQVAALLQRRQWHSLVSVEALMQQRDIVEELHAYTSTIVQASAAVRVALSKPVASQAIICHREFQEDVLQVLSGMAEDLAHFGRFESCLKQQFDSILLDDALGTIHIRTASHEAFADAIQKVRTIMNQFAEQHHQLQQTQQ